MKKIILAIMLAAACCMALPYEAQAQRSRNDRPTNSRMDRRPDNHRDRGYDRFGGSPVSLALDIHGGIGLNDGTKAVGGADLVFLAECAYQFSIGMGAGLDYVHGLYQYEADGTLDNQGELTLPLFARARYAFYNPFVTPFIQADLGYRFGLKSFNKDRDNKFGDCTHKGFFVEPQAGISFGPTALALGVSFQRYTKRTSDVLGTITSKPAWAPALMLHYSLQF